MHVTERAMGGVADVASARVSVSMHCFGLINGCTITHSFVDQQQFKTLLFKVHWAEVGGTSVDHCRGGDGY
jgi:hypothetical protein